MRPRVPSRTTAVAVTVTLVGVGLAGVVGFSSARSPRAAAGPERLAGGTSPAEAAPFPVPKPGEAGVSTCLDPIGRRQWRVTWRATQGASGMTVVPTGFAERPAVAQRSAGADAAAPVPNGGWTSRDADAWALGWVIPSVTATDWARRVEVRGNLAVLGRRQTPLAYSPRYVSPDGSCTVFIDPFADGPPAGPTVAVIGDSLVWQLLQATRATAPLGLLPRALENRDRRFEVVGQPGRRWTIFPDTTPGLDQADGTLLDEIRGLRGAHAQVIALGTNDAGWVALSTSDQMYQLRLAWVILHLAPIIDEIRSSGQCTVLVTAGDRDESYLGSQVDRFSQAMQDINDYLRRRAEADPNDDLHLWDWAEHVAGHHVGARDSWYAADTIHLNARGRVAYADELTQASALCP